MYQVLKKQKKRKAQKMFIQRKKLSIEKFYTLHISFPKYENFENNVL